MIKIEVKLKNNPYPILIKRGLKNNLSLYLKKLQLGNLGFVLTSPSVYRLYKKTIKKNFSGKGFKIIVSADGEKAKSKYWLFKIIKTIVELDKKNKKPFIICLGGGTIGDLGGFAASIYKRGIPCIQIPTTLIGQIDSSIGGKTAIDLPEAKNILGSFYQPKAVLIDPDFLKTLSKKDLREGLAEAIKYGIIKDKELFSLIKNNPKKILNLEQSLIDKIIFRCAKIKAKIVEEDEKEKKGIRTILNFGHTFAHGLEAASQYKKISHGKAVAIGMLYAACLSYDLNRCSMKEVEEIKQILALYNLPIKINFNPQKVLNSINYDKKFTTGKIKMVLIKRIAAVEVSTKITAGDLKKAFKKIN
ncbi:MAG: 3-dehydroquinate synthase [Candidatus Omnitrophica bacterium]|nr:3-dehydroquinate synthase [Candidatus Omnitrophota bacterium]MCF7876822.1 3-dehydroquinate synthase [Candidatus Omnitrophota bacterium]MCF7878117.1 3-dehydroquinate synthase [Candidatus Omnitrophota bacterium]MCF7892979.1 3-dehydroquinate synthase [Candidatus Omnitrophota bacterium]